MDRRLGEMNETGVMRLRCLTSGIDEPQGNAVPSSTSLIYGIDCAAGKGSNSTTGTYEQQKSYGDKRDKEDKRKQKKSK